MSYPLWIDADLQFIITQITAELITKQPNGSILITTNEMTFMDNERQL